MKKYYLLLVFLLIQSQGFANEIEPVVTNADDACATLTLTSGTNVQTVCVNSAIQIVTYLVGNGGTAAVIDSGALPPGVTATYNTAAQVFTLSGTPTAAGTFTFQVTTVGGDCSASLTGTITVNPNTSLSLSSSTATSFQTVCINTPITPIAYTVGNGGTGTIVTGLPSGINGVFSGNTVTISGIAAVSGTYNYTVTTTGGCSTAILSGVITVVPNTSITLSPASGAPYQTACLNTPIYSIVYSVGNGATGASVTGLPASISASFSAGTVTISGASAVVGNFPYTINTSGGCGSVFVPGTLTILPYANLTLTSSPALDHQTVCLNTPLVPITYALENTTAATVNGLPPGVTGSVSNGTLTISGMPTVAGVYNYTALAEGCTGNFSVGVINVPPNPNAPVTMSTTYCQNATAVPLMATGTNLLWYAAATGGIGSTVAPIPSTAVPGVYSYYVSQTTSCEGPRAASVVVVMPSAVIDIVCDGAGSSSNSVAFDWTNIPGATGYNYSYTIGSNPAVSGTVSSPSNFTVTGVSAGQLVTFTVTSVDGVMCFNPQSTTCLLQPLANQQFDKETFMHFPNPVEDVLYLEHESPFQSIVIFDMLGKKTLERKANENKLQIDLSQLQKGFYLATVTTAKGNQTFKIIKE